MSDQYSNKLTGRSYLLTTALR